MRNIGMRRQAPWLAASLLLGVAGGPALSGAQTVPQDGVVTPGQAGSPSDHVSRPAGGVSRGVITPKGGVDPGMTVKVPHLPQRSTPVIHPQQTSPDGGTVVVPK